MIPIKGANGLAYLTSLMAQVQMFSKFCQPSPFGHPTSLVQVKLIGTLLSSFTLAWFAPLLKHQSPLFNDFEAFLEEFNATFGDFNKKCTFNIKI
jgi:hypothetical protein